MSCYSVKLTSPQVVCEDVKIIPRWRLTVWIYLADVKYSPKRPVWTEPNKRKGVSANKKELHIFMPALDLKKP